MNSVNLIGRIGTAPELRSTTTGKSVATFSIAVGKGDEPQWFRITAWGKTADFVASYLDKGRLVGVSGKLQSRKYTASDGSTREVVEVVAHDVQALDRPREDTKGGSTEQAAASTEDYDVFADE